MSLTSQWNGYYLNHCVSSTKSSLLVYQNPRNINWTTDLITPLRHELITYKFLRVGKKYFLEHNINSIKQEILDKPVLILVKLYDYGSFENNLPQHRKSFIYSVFQNHQSTPIELRQYLKLPNDLISPQKIISVAHRRRTDALLYLQTRAYEIDRILGDTSSLVENVFELFREYSLEIDLYKSVGSLSICDRITESLNADVLSWLKKEIPIDKDENNNAVMAVVGEEIKRILTEATEDITIEELKDFYSSTFSEFKINELF